MADTRYFIGLYSGLPTKIALIVMVKLMYSKLAQLIKKDDFLQKP